MIALILTHVQAAMTTYTSPKTAEMVTLILTHVQAAMTTYTVPKTAEMIALILEHVQAAMTTYTSPKTAEMIALILTHVQAAMTTFTSPTTAEMEAIVIAKVGEVIEDKDLPTALEVVDAVLDVTYGKRTDGTNVRPTTLGRHWWDFYPGQIVRVMAELTLDGTAPATRFTPTPGTLPDGSFGKVMLSIKDNTKASNEQTKRVVPSTP
jgi:hypothetical protein